MTVWCVYKVSDVSLKTHMGGCGGGVCWCSAMVTSPYSRCHHGHRQLWPAFTRENFSVYNWNILHGLGYNVSVSVELGLAMHCLLFDLFVIRLDTECIILRIILVGILLTNELTAKKYSYLLVWKNWCHYTTNTNKTLLLIHSQHTCICIDTMLQWLL